MTPQKKQLKSPLFYVFFFLCVLLFFSSCEEGNTNVPYPEMVQALKKEQQILQDGYQQVNSEEVKKLFIILARKHLMEAITNELFAPWYGTTWAMNGTSQTPKKGTIACGYFVSTILRDAGFKVSRRTLAQQASENIVKTLTPEQDIKRFQKTPLKKFLKRVADMGEGLYVVGLDTHVGFLEVRKNNIYFIHSAQSTGKKVVKEKAIRSKVLRRSKYRIVGNFLANESLLRKWLQNDKIITVKIK